MVLKRKALTQLAQKATSSSKIAADEDAFAEEPTKIMKRPAAASANDEEMDHEEVEEGMEEEEEEEEGQEEMSEEDKVKKEEEEIVSARRKELKSTYIDELKELASSAGLALKKKEEIVEGLIKHEAKLRAEDRAHKAKIRAVVEGKKVEFDSKPMSELKKLCDAAEIKGAVSKHDRVQCLLREWQNNDGIDKALAEIAYNARKEELFDMEKDALLKLCRKTGVDPYLTEVMVERVVKEEAAAGLFCRSAPPKEGEACAPEKNTSLVDDLIASEATRKKDKEVKKQRDEATAKRRKELAALSVDELRKRLEKRKMEATGKKDELVEALFAVCLQEDTLAARKEELRAMPSGQLKEILLSKQLPTKSKKDDMVESVLAQEAKAREEERAFEAKVEEVLKKKREELEVKSNPELKQLCANNGLKLGVAKEERLNALLQFAKDGGEVDKILETMARNARREQLMVMDKSNLLKLCGEAGVDPLVKEIMVERLMEQGSNAEPAMKKARTK